jgi:two-component sensor histidine kinase
MTVKVIGLDIAKNIFQVHGVNEAGEVVLRRKLRRSELDHRVKNALATVIAVSQRTRGGCTSLLQPLWLLAMM